MDANQVLGVVFSSGFGLHQLLRDASGSSVAQCSSIFASLVLTVFVQRFFFGDGQILMLHHIETVKLWAVKAKQWAQIC